MENGSASKVERYEAENLSGGGYVDKEEENVEHQFHGVE
jgi:hypothetical protein